MAKKINYKTLFSIFIFLMFIIFISYKYQFKAEPNNKLKVGDECWIGENKMSESEIPDGLQCYYYGEGETRKGIIIMLDKDYNDFLVESYDPQYFSEHKKLTTNWNLFRDPKGRYSFKYPTGTFIDNGNEGYITLALGNTIGIPDEPIRFQIRVIENNVVKSSDNFPKGCYESSITLDNKEFDRFDCEGKTNIEQKYTELFRQEKDFYYWIMFNKTGSPILDYYTEAIINSLRFL